VEICKKRKRESHAKSWDSKREKKVVADRTLGREGEMGRLGRRNQPRLRGKALKLLHYVGHTHLKQKRPASTPFNRRKRMAGGGAIFWKGMSRTGKLLKERESTTALRHRLEGKREGASC